MRKRRIESERQPRGRARGRPPGVRFGGGGSEDEDEDEGGCRDGGVPDDEVGDEVSRTWSRTSREPRECTRNEAAAGARRRTDPFSSD